MANIVQIKRSSVAGKTPDASSLQTGELAVNLIDGILYSKNATGTVVVVGSSTTSNVREEGNLYFTNTRAVNAFIEGDNITIESNGRISSTATGGGSGGNVTVSASPPASPNSGDNWIDEDTGKIYTYFNDGDSNQWVELSSVNVQSGATIDLSSISSNILPSANQTYNIGSDSYQWKSLHISGNADVGGTVTADVFLGDGSQLSGVSTGGANLIVIGRVTNSFVVITNGNIIIEGRTSNTNVSVI